MILCLILNLPDHERAFTICTDASKEGLDGVLMQENFVVTLESDQLKERAKINVAIAYESWKLKDDERNYVMHDLELVSIVHALKFCRHYLIGRLVTLKTNHHSLQYLFSQPILNTRQSRWVEFLAEFDEKIDYIKVK